MELFPHLWEAFSLGPIEVVVEYHKPVTIREIGNRKALAAYCEKCCRDGQARALVGRWPEVVPDGAALTAAEGAVRRLAGAGV
jgi:1-acyl-sn-glycerol-3-phosphate acyltransferase